jgi:hypothetical protein
MNMPRKKKVIETELVMEPKPLSNEFVFIGNGKDDPAWISMFGYMFGLNGRAIEVKNEWLAIKLRGNSHFREV